MRARAWALVGLAIMIAGCAATRRAMPFDEGVAVDSPALQRGQRIFMTHCQSCHPGGEAGLGPALNNKPLPGPLIAFQVRHGLGAMPAFGPAHISDEELEALVDYVIALRRAE